MAVPENEPLVVEIGKYVAVDDFADAVEAAAGSAVVIGDGLHEATVAIAL